MVNKGDVALGGPARVEYTVSAFKKAGFVDGGRLMLLAPTGDRVHALEALRDTIASCTDTWSGLEVDDVWIRVRPPAVGPDGPLAYVEDAEPSKALSRMLEDVARGLEERGVSGRLKPAPSASSSYFGSLMFPAWNAAMKLRAPADSQESGFDWKSDRAMSSAALGLIVDWLLDTDGPVYVSNGANFSVPPEEALTILLDSAARDNLVWMKRTDNERRLRELHVRGGGWVSLVHYDVDRPRLELLDGLTGVLERISPFISFGFVRDGFSRARDQFELLSRSKHPAPIAGRQDWNAFAFSAPLESDYVYDANVSQVVTTSQLAKMRLDPRTWAVRDLGGGRHAVEHLNPEAWFDPTPHPVDSRLLRRPSIEPDVLAMARDDFHDAIFNREVLLNSQPLADPRQEARRGIDIDPSLQAQPLRPVRVGEQVKTAERRWWDHHALPTLSAVLLLPVDLESLYDWPGFGSNYAWHVRDEVARAALAPALDWVLATDGPVTLSYSGELVPPARAGERFHEGLTERPYDLLAPRYDRPRLERTPHGGLFRRVSILDYGMAVVHSYDTTRSKLEQFDDLVQILQDAAPHLTAGFVREVSTASIWRHGVLVNQKPIVPYGPRRGKKPWDYAGFNNAAHLESEFVYDAFVAQVMTRAQFERTNLDAARWDIAEVAGDRFAVHARTPADWFDRDPRPLDCRGKRGGPAIDNVIAQRPSPVAPKILEAARADFGQAIMTAQTVAMRPPELSGRNKEKFERKLGVALGRS